MHARNIEPMYLAQFAARNGLDAQSAKAVYYSMRALWKLNPALSESQVDAILLAGLLSVEGEGPAPAAWARCACACAAEGARIAAREFKTLCGPFGAC